MVENNVFLIHLSIDLQALSSKVYNNLAVHIEFPVLCCHQKTHNRKFHYVHNYFKMNMFVTCYF